jgi:glycosyltransferase involved in cell wall biosynthesis
MVLVREQAPDVTLVLAGSGPLTEDLKRSAAAIRIDDRVRFLGEQPDVGGILRQAKVFAMSSVNEGLPISMLEAMSAGLPQVVTAVGGMKEIMELSGAGAMAQPKDAAAIAEAILRFRNDEAWRLECGKRARECYDQHFTPGRMAADYEALYRV